jgi:hypothetical protein
MSLPIAHYNALNVYNDRQSKRLWLTINTAKLPFNIRLSTEVKLLTNLAYKRDAITLLGTFVAVDNCANKIASKTDKRFFEERQSRIINLELAVAGLKKTQGSDLDWRRSKLSAGYAARHYGARRAT